MNLIFSPPAWDEYLYWQENDRRVLRRINALLKDTLRAPLAGIGKPEPLRGEFAGFWSRRLTEEHRMVYQISGVDLLLVQLRYQY